MWVASKAPALCACGHDAHSNVTRRSKAAAKSSGKINGTVRLIFQPAEEEGNGAETIIKQGAADGVDYFFGLHIKEFTEVGTISGRTGPQMAGAETFKLTVSGAAHHAGMPHLMGGVDATVVASEIVLALQTIVSRRVNPLDTAVVSIGTFHSGTRSNIISGQAQMEGTLRYQSEEIRELIKSQMIKIASECTGSRIHRRDRVGTEHSPVINHDWVTSVAFKAAEKVTGDPKKLVIVRGTTGAEDFGAYSKHGKACFLTVGVGGSYPGHNPKLVVDENAMPYGCALMVQVALDLLNTEEPDE